MTTLRVLGDTGLKVSPLGFGAGPLGDPAIDDAYAVRLLRTALDLGISLIDTAPSYGASESRIGRVLATMTPSARDRVVIATKGGYGVPGVADWTPEVIERGIDQALDRLHTERIDVFLLHSCPLDRLQRGDLIAPLERAKSSGKIVATGYSGDGAPLVWALRSMAFDVVECSVNLVDQEALAVLGMNQMCGVLAKRSLAGAPWNAAESSGASSAYADRWRAFVEASNEPRDEKTIDMDPDEMAIRFAAHAPRVCAALFGTRRIANLQRVVELAARGPLPHEMTARIHARFAKHGGEGRWPGII